MKLITITIIAFCISFGFTQGQEENIEQQEFQHPQQFHQNEVNPDQFELPEDHIDQQYLQKVEGQAFQSQVNEQINPWVAEELKQTKSTDTFPKIDSFTIHLQPEESFEFKWDLAIPDSKKRQYSFIVSVFSYEYGDDMALITNPLKEEYVEIYSKNNIHDSYSKFGQVYVEKAFKTTFDTDQDSKFFHVLNRNEQNIVIQFQLQKQKEQLSQLAAGALKNEHFSIPAQKLEAIFSQFKQNDKARTKMSKWQWGFLQRQERYDSEMLKLTGVELLVIIVTAIVQMYCIKNALDKKQII